MNFRGVVLIIGVSLATLTIACTEENGVKPLSASSITTNSDSESDPDSKEVPLSLMTIQGLADISTFAEEPLTLKVTVLTSDPDYISYRWLKGGIVLQESIDPTFSIASLAEADAGQYDLEVVHNPLGVTPTVVSTDSMMLTVRPSSEKPAMPVFTFEQADKTVNEGDALVLEVGAVGVPDPTIEWFKDGNSVGTGAEYRVDAATLTDAGEYHAVATNASGSAQSMAAQVMVVQTTCAMPNNTTASVGGTYSTGCVYVACLDDFGNAIGNNTTYTCQLGGTLTSQTVVCTTTNSNCIVFDGGDGG